MNLNSTLYAELITAHESDIEKIKMVALEASEMRAKHEATARDLAIKIAECGGITEGQKKWMARTQRDIERLEKQIAFLDRRVKGCDHQIKVHQTTVAILKRKLGDNGAAATLVKPELIAAATASDERPARTQNAERAKRKQRARDKSADAESAKSLKPKKKDKQAA